MDRQRRAAATGTAVRHPPAGSQEILACGALTREHRWIAFRRRYLAARLPWDLRRSARNEAYTACTHVCFASWLYKSEPCESLGRQDATRFCSWINRHSLSGSRPVFDTISRRSPFNGQRAPGLQYCRA